MTPHPILRWPATAATLATLALPLLVLSLPALSACAAKAPVGSLAAPEEEEAGAAALREPTASSASAPNPATADRKLVYTVEMVIEVADPEGAATAVEEAAEAAGGFVSKIDAWLSGDEPAEVSMTVRVPSARLDGLLRSIRDLATRVTRESREVEDVTARYVDLDARVRTLKRTEAELEELLGESRERGSKAEEIMAVYRELTEVRSQRESIEGTLRVLARQVELSTVHLRLTPHASSLPLRQAWRPGETVHRAARTLLAGLRGLADFAIFTLIAVVPLLLLVALPIWWLIRLLRRRRRRG